MQINGQGSPSNYDHFNSFRSTMKSFSTFALAISALISQAAAHCASRIYISSPGSLTLSPISLDTFPSLVVGGTTTAAWVNVRQTNNFNTQAPVTDVTSSDLRCYDSAEAGTATTISVAAGQQLGIMSDGTIYHPGVSYSFSC